MDRKGLYQRNQALKYLKRAFTSKGEEEGEDALPSDITSDDMFLFMASIANSLLYVGDQLYEIVSLLEKSQNRVDAE